MRYMWTKILKMSTVHAFKRHISAEKYFYRIHCGEGVVQAWYCKCKAGSRVVGCKAHIFSVFGYLSYARHKCLVCMIRPCIRKTPPIWLIKQTNSDESGTEEWSLHNVAVYHCTFLYLPNYACSIPLIIKELLHKFLHTHVSTSKKLTCTLRKHFAITFFLDSLCWLFYLDF